MDVDNLNIDKKVISDKFPCAKKVSTYYVSYKNNEKIIPLCVLSLK